MVYFIFSLECFKYDSLNIYLYCENKATHLEIFITHREMTIDFQETS